MKRRCCGQYSVANCRCDVSTFELGISMFRPSKIDDSTLGNRCIDLRRSMFQPCEIDVSTFEARCVETLIFEGRHIDLRRSKHRSPKVLTLIETSIFEDRRWKHRTDNYLRRSKHRTDNHLRSLKVETSHRQFATEYCPQRRSIETSPPYRR